MPDLIITGGTIVGGEVMQETGKATEVRPGKVRRGG
jgi:hypothetical protein